MRKIVSLILMAMCVISMSLAQNSDLKAQIEMLEKKVKSEPENKEYLLNLGILYHSLAQEGNKEGVQKGEEVFKKLLDIDSKNAQAYCWYGSLLTLKGKYASLPFNKVKFVNNGTKKMDKAVELAPDDIMVRMIRAQNSLGLPEFFQKLDVAINDFEHLLSLHKNKPKLFSKELLANIYFGLGIAWKRKDNPKKAEENWQKVIEIAPDSTEAKKAKELLH